MTEPEAIRVTTPAPAPETPDYGPPEAVVPIVTAEPGFVTLTVPGKCALFMPAYKALLLKQAIEDAIADADPLVAPSRPQVVDGEPGLG